MVCWLARALNSRERLACGVFRWSPIIPCLDEAVLLVVCRLDQLEKGHEDPAL
jgi:hypothetical protein